MGIVAVVFDLDGTLIDSFALIAAAYRHAARRVLDRVLGDEEVVARWGEPLAVRAADVAPGRTEEFIAAYTAYYDAHHDPLCASFPGVPEMLSALASRGCRLAVATSKRRRSTLQALERCGLGSWIHTAVSAEDVRAPKPAPDAVAEALARLRATPSEAWMVGDAAFDIQAARAADVRSVAALWGTREHEALLAARPDYVAPRPGDVVSLVAST